LPCTHESSKRVTSANNVPFGDFVKNGHPQPITPKFKKLHYKIRLLLKPRINLGVSASQFRSRIGNSPPGFQNFGFKNLTGSSSSSVEA